MIDLFNVIVNFIYHTSTYIINSYIGLFVFAFLLFGALFSLVYNLANRRY